MTSAEIKAAMEQFKQVRYNGILYQRITAMIYRVVQTSKRGTYTGILSCELLAGNGNSVTVAPADRVEVVT